MVLRIRIPTEIKRFTLNGCLQKTIMENQVMKVVLTKFLSYDCGKGFRFLMILNTKVSFGLIRLAYGNEGHANIASKGLLAF